MQAARFPARAVLSAVLLLAAPFAVYAPTILHEYGFRDDYSLQEESRATPGSLIRFTSSYGRPIYGALLVATLQGTDTVADFKWLRGLSVLLLALVAAATWRILLKAGWTATDAAAAALALAFLPSAQVLAGWAIAWPIAFATLCAALGFIAVNAATRPGRSRVGFVAGAVLYAVATLTYQPSALFAVVPLAGCLLVRTDAARERTVWAAAHLATLFGSVAAALGAMQLAFSLGAVPASDAMAFEEDPLGKLGWFLTQPLVNAIALFALRDRLDTDATFWIAAVACAAAILVGTLAGPRHERRIDRVTLWFCLLALPFAAHSVSLAAVLRTPAYRTLWPLAGLMAVLAVFALRRLQRAGRLSLRVHAVLLLAGIALGGALAARNAFALIAEPQGREWALVRDGVEALPTGRALDVFIVRPRMEERSTRRIFADEFGSLSTNSDWATAAMFRAAVRERFPDGVPKGTSYTVTSGLDGPRVSPIPDAVIDMRPLREHRSD